MKLPELKELAKQMGLRGTSTMRKPELLATLQAARNGGEPPAGVTVRAPKAAKTAKVVKAPQSDAAEANTTDNADVATQSPAPAPAATEPQLDLPLPVADDAKKDETEPRRTRRKAADDAASEPRAARRRRDDDQPDFARRKPRKKADEAGDLRSTDGEVEVIHRPQAAEFDAQVAALQNGGFVDVPLRNDGMAGNRDHLALFKFLTHRGLPPFFWE